MERRVGGDGRSRRPLVEWDKPPERSGAPENPTPTANETPLPYRPNRHGRRGCAQKNINHLIWFVVIKISVSHRTFAEVVRYARCDKRNCFFSKGQELFPAVSHEGGIKLRKVLKVSSFLVMLGQKGRNIVLKVVIP